MKSEEKYIRPNPQRPGSWVFRFGKIRKSFRSREDAIIARDQHLAAMRADGRSALLTASELLEYRRAKELAGGRPLDEIVRDWLRVCAVGLDAPKLGDALDSWRARCERRSLSPRTLEAYAATSRKMLSAFPDAPLSELTDRRLLDWYFRAEGSARTRRGVLANMLSFLGYCAENKWIASVPRIRRHQLEREEKNPVAVFSVSEIREIFSVLESRFRLYVPNFALRAYAGIRTEEASKMRWEWIDFDRKRIVVPASACKTRDAWTLQAPSLPDKVFRMLAPYRRASGEIPAPVRNGAATKIASALSFPWKRNGLRHTFCTMHISLFGDASKTATLLKHQGVATLYRHYCGQLVTPEEAAEYFS